MTREEKVNLLNELLEIEEKNDIGNLTSTDRREFQQWVEDLEQEPKTGHWIDDGFYAEGHSHKAFHCSKCGHNVLGFKEDLSNYCPNCGARMIEPQESEEA